MARFFPCFLMLAFFAPQQACDAVGPDQLKTQTEDSLREFFPKVRAHVYPEKEFIIAITCTANVGNKLIEEVQKTVAQKPELQRLRQLRMYGRPFGVRSYRMFAIGFEQGLIRYNVDTNLVSVEWRQDDAYKSEFRKECNIPNE